MLLLVAIAFVLVGIATLLIGIFSDTLTWVFVSIGSTVLAALVLYVLFRLGRRQVALATAPSTPAAPEPAAVATPARPKVAASTAAAPEPVEESAPTLEVELALEFPIAEYDDLRVVEILPLLPELDAEELVLVRAHEAGTKSRATILARIDDLAGSVPAVAPVASVAPAKKAASATSAFAPPATTDGLPIVGYDDMKLPDLLASLASLDGDELEAVGDYEEKHANRQAVLNRVDTLLDEIDASVLAAEDVTPPKKAAPRKAASASTAKKTPAKKAPAAKKAVAVKKAAPVKKAVAVAPKKVAAKKAAAKRAPATAPAKKVGRPRKTVS